MSVLASDVLLLRTRKTSSASLCSMRIWRTMRRLLRVSDGIELARLGHRFRIKLEGQNS